MKYQIANNIRAPKSNKVFVKFKRIILILNLMGFAIILNAQEVKFELQLKNASIESMINELRKQSELDFIYNYEEVSKCKPISISIKDVSLEDALTEAFKNTGLTFKQVNNTIVITPIDPQSYNKVQPKKVLNQTVRGTILDIDSKMPMIGAMIVIPGTDPLIGTTTDLDGTFRLEKMPIGRVTLKLSYVGYEEKTIANIVVNSGKETVLNITMEEKVYMMNNIVIKAFKQKGTALNDMSLISARSISPEETKRYAGAFSDPSRILSAFAGVANSQNAENDIIVRGNSPKYVQWRLEGLEIENPTHFGDQNSIKGGISALNNNLLATSDFYTGAFSPEYGNVLSGVYDIKLRAGNNEKFETAAGIGLLGTDITLEGPFKKGYGGSFLINYRYSTVTLIDKIGLVSLEGSLSFQDATFKVVLPTKKAGAFSIFGLGGLSGFKQKDILPDNQPIPNNGIVRSDITKDFNKDNFLSNLGMRHTFMVNDNSYIKSSLSYSNSGNEEDAYSISTLKTYNDAGDILLDSVSNRVLDYKNRLSKSSYRAAITYNNKINAKNKIQIGTKYSLFDYNYEQSFLEANATNLFTLIDFKHKISTIRNFIGWKHRLNEHITIVSGIHNMNVLFNNKHTLEPRFGLNVKLDKTNAIHAGYGSHSNMESIHNYFAKVEQPDGSVIEPNRDLDLLKANHYVIGYEKRFSKNLLGKIECYYQHLYNLPVENNDTSYYATINEGTDFRYVDLVNKGTGKNYGMEFTLEKFLDNNYYFFLNASIYESKYKSLENVLRNTQYNSKYLVNILVGKEFEKIGKKDNQTLALNAKGFLSGGRKIISLLVDEEGNVAVDPDNNRYWDYDNAYENHLEDIFQLNVSVSYKFNRPTSTHEIFLDLINVTNNTSKVFEYYDENAPDSKGYVSQFGFFPNLMYRVYF